MINIINYIEESSMKRALKHIAKILIYTLFFGLLYPFIDRHPAPTLLYTSFEHWMSCLAVAVVVYLITLYFTIKNPRKFYYCASPISFVLFTVFILLEIFAFVFAGAFIDAILPKIFAIIGVIILVAFTIYATFHRGICIYDSGKIRIFKFKIYSYPAATPIEYIGYEMHGQKQYIKIELGGDTHTFRIIKLCRNRLDWLIAKSN